MTRGRPLRIAIFHLGFFYSGGGEKLVLQQATWLRARGHDVEVYAPIVDEDACFPELMHEVRPRRVIGRAPDLLGVGDGLTLIGASLAAGWLTRDIDADVYLGANQPGAWLARAAARGHGRRYVTYLSQPNRLLLPRAIDRVESAKAMRREFHLLSAMALVGRPLLDELDRRSVRDATVRLGDGAYITTVLRFYYGGAWRSCPAGTRVPRATLATARERHTVTVRAGGRSLRGPFVLLTNRHYPQKRFQDMFPVLERVRATVPGATLVITGAETSYTDRLRAEVSARGLGDAVHFLGLLPEEELDRVYRAAAAYVYPSPEEDFGMGIVEAMARGAPVIAWDNAGPTGILDRRSGRLVPLGDLDGFADAVLAVLTDEAHADALAGAAAVRARELFSEEAHTDVLEQALYEAARPPAGS